MIMSLTRIYLQSAFINSAVANKGEKRGRGNYKKERKKAFFIFQALSFIEIHKNRLRKI